MPRNGFLCGMRLTRQDRRVTKSWASNSREGAIVDSFGALKQAMVERENRPLMSCHATKWFLSLTLASGRKMPPAKHIYSWLDSQAASRSSQRGIHILVNLARFPADQLRTRVSESAAFLYHGRRTLAVISDGVLSVQLRSRLRSRLDVDHADCGEYSWCCGEYTWYRDMFSSKMARRVVPNSASW